MKYLNVMIGMLIAVILSACGGGGGSTGPAPVDPPQVSNVVKGVVSASKENYFGGSTAQSSSRAFAKSAKKLESSATTWDCTNQYRDKFAGLPKNVQTPSGTLNVPNASNVVTFNVDDKGQNKPDLNVIQPNTQQLKNKDVDCDAVADINLDTNSDGQPDKYVDSNLDDQPDYSVSSDNSLTVINAQVTIKKQDTGETQTAVTDREGTFTFNNVNPGDYHLEVKARAADGSMVWHHSTRQLDPQQSNMGTFGLNRHPLIKTVVIDGETINDVLTASFTKMSARQLSVGDTINIQVALQDPNDKPVSIKAYLRGQELPAVNGNIQYTVTSNDVQGSSLEFLVEGNNDDNLKGLDAYRDTLTKVVYQVAGASAPPSLAGVLVNGNLFANAHPTTGMTVQTEAMLPGASLIVEAQTSDNVNFQWFENGSLRQAQSKVVTISSNILEGYYQAKIDLVTYKSPTNGTYSQIVIPVQTSDKPAELNGILVNGTDPSGHVYRVGDSLSVATQTFDPLGRTMQCRFQVIGGSGYSQDWGSCQMIYSVQKSDVNANFRIRVWVKNDDGRVQGPTDDSDAKGEYVLTMSE